MGVDDFLYRRVARPLLFKLNPDFIHEVMLDLGEFSGRFPVLRGMIGLVYRYRGPDISKIVDGVRYELPVLLSAGFDADGRLTRVLRDVSFGGEEIGKPGNAIGMRYNKRYWNKSPPDADHRRFPRMIPG